MYYEILVDCKHDLNHITLVLPAWIRKECQHHKSNGKSQTHLVYFVMFCCVTLIVGTRQRKITFNILYYRIRFFIVSK